ncbi:hypothetical protein [Brachyspira catarrhinii]|uniref:Uncharacterized protein n=1 Tax=Brachyspira catarrhinii TaxID=2528966 RepID=A0ABY2TQZ0_9SPIR|nr:hypothetical protein [Brachyspira catarrhinii]TKZ34803.1 hypothetical protein EZH24_07590 [Brachyspira catarrhinii]
MKNKTKNSPFLIKVKGTQGGIGYCRKQMVCDYFKEYKGKVRLVDVVKNDKQTIYYIEYLENALSEFNKDYSEIKKLLRIE